MLGMAVDPGSFVEDWSCVGDWLWRLIELMLGYTMSLFLHVIN